MITAATKRKLVIFALLVVVGMAYTGARYAKLDQLVWNKPFTVVAKFHDGGGIFEDAEVTYRGFRVGKVDKMQLTRQGINIELAIDKGMKIPAKTLAVVGNKSAVGEQYLELQPMVKAGPYLHDGSVIPEANSRTPIPTVTLLSNVDDLVTSVPKNDLRTSITELGNAFQGTGQSLGQIIDTTNSFIQQAQINFSATTNLIRDSRVVLQTQADKAGAIRSFSRDLALLTGTLAGHDADLRHLIDNGSATANELRTFLAQNQVPIGQLLQKLVATEQVTIAHIKGLRQMLVLYPWVVEGGFTVVDKSSGKYDARFGLVLNTVPDVCTHGYESTDRRPPQDLSDRPMNTRAHCAEPASKTDARGAGHAPNGRTGASYRAGFGAPSGFASGFAVPMRPGAQAPVVAIYNRDTGKVTWTDHDPMANTTRRGGDQQLFGANAWRELLLQPAGTP